MATFVVQTAALRDAPMPYAEVFLKAATEKPSLFNRLKNVLTDDPNVLTDDPAQLTESDVAKIGRALCNFVSASRSPKMAAAEFFEAFPVLAKITQDCVWFRPMIDVMSARIMKVSLKTRARLVGRFALCLFDFVSDIYIMTVYIQAGRVPSALGILACQFVNCAVQCLTVTVANAHLGMGAVFREILIVLSFMKPVVDSWRLASGYEKPGAPFDTQVELFACKVRYVYLTVAAAAEFPHALWVSSAPRTYMSEMAALPRTHGTHSRAGVPLRTVGLFAVQIIDMSSKALPSAVIQLHYLVSYGGWTNWISLLSILSQWLVVAYECNRLTVAFDHHVEGKKVHPAFYGFIPRGPFKTKMSRAFLFFFSLTMTVERTLAIAMLSGIGSEWAAGWFIAELGLYLLYKVARRDFYAWAPNMGVPGSLVYRTMPFVMCSFTGLPHLRHPNEVGGACWIFLVLVSHPMCLGSGCFFLEYASNTAIPRTVLFSVLSTLASVGALSLCGFLLTVQGKYRRTFYSLETSTDYGRRHFMEHDGSDFHRFDVFHRNERHWASFRDEVKAWVMGNIAKWEEEKPEWLTPEWLAKVPPDWLTPTLLAKVPSEALPSDALGVGQAQTPRTPRQSLIRTRVASLIPASLDPTALGTYALDPTAPGTDAQRGRAVSVCASSVTSADVPLPSRAPPKMAELRGWKSLSQLPISEPAASLVGYARTQHESQHALAPVVTSSSLNRDLASMTTRKIDATGEARKAGLLVGEQLKSSKSEHRIGSLTPG